jgi:AcrR family transcriptional regulator
MNDRHGTAATLIDAGRELFSTHGYDGTSIRALTTLAGVNLGAVTYHFGSKEALYEAVAAAVVRPLRDVVTGIAALGTPPLERLDTLVRGVLRHLHDHPELPRFMIQLLASDRPVPAAAGQFLRDNMGAVAGVIAEGQQLGAIRPGNPRLMALSILGPSIWVAASRRVLAAALSLNQDDEQARAELADAFARFVRGGLVPAAEEGA